MNAIEIVELIDWVSDSVSYHNTYPLEFESSYDKVYYIDEYLEILKKEVPAFLALLEK